MIRRIGNRVILVGVAHVFPESIDEVREVILEEKPQTVAVELDKARYLKLMQGPQERESAQTGLSMSILFTKILTFFQERIGQKTGMMPGEEMLTAIRKAEEVGAEVSLIDRNINLTFQRLMDKMSLWEKFKILFKLLLSLFYSGDEIKYEDLKEEEAIDNLVEMLRDESETMYEVFLEERNRYMRDRIFELLNSRNGKIVCVVGAGHLRGLEQDLQAYDFEEDFPGWGKFRYDWRIR